MSKVLTGKANADNSFLLLCYFMGFLFVFGLFCFVSYFGGFDMSDKVKKGIAIGFILLMSAISILFVVFFSDEKYNYSNYQEIPESGITLIYTDKNKKTKICFVKYYEENELPELTTNLKINDMIYISKETPIEKSFFDNLKNFDYKVKFPDANVRIEITGTNSKKSFASKQTEETNINAENEKKK